MVRKVGMYGVPWCNVCLDASTQGSCINFVFSFYLAVWWTAWVWTTEFMTSENYGILIISEFCGQMIGVQVGREYHEQKYP